MLCFDKLSTNGGGYGAPRRSRVVSRVRWRGTLAGLARVL